MSAPPPDGRSVGELLVEAEQQVRDALHDAPDRAGLAMAQGWIEVVGAAAELWGSLRGLDDAPTAGAGETPKPGADGMDQMLAHATSVQRRIARASTGQGAFATPVDETMVEVAGLHYRAADMVERHKPRATAGPSPELAADIEATRTRIMHTVYVASHVTTVALSDDLSRRSREANAPTGIWTDALRRIGASEAIAGQHVRQGYPGALQGEHRDPVHPSRLADAQSAWDVEAHRALSQAPMASTLRYIARVEDFRARAGMMFWRLAAEAGLVDPSQHRVRLSPALENMAERWGKATDVWGGLDPREPVAGPLKAAGAELRAATRELLHDQAAPANARVLSSRTDLAALVPTLQNSLATAVDLSHAFRDSIGSMLQVKPKAVHALQNEQIREMAFPNRRWATEEEARAQGMPLSSLGSQSTPLPPLLVATLRGQAHQSVRAATESLSAATGIERRPARQETPARWGPARAGTPVGTGVERLRAVGSIGPRPAVDGPAR